MRAHRLEQVPGGDHVLAVVARGVGDRLADVGARGEVHHAPRPVLAEAGVERRAVLQVDQGDGRLLVRHQLAVAGREVVEHHHALALLREVPHGVAADVARPAGDQDGPVASFPRCTHETGQDSARPRPVFSAFPAYPRAPRRGERAMASDPELLLERADWVRRLAGGLAASAADADDLAQDALLAALERPPRAGVPLGKWLAAVVRNRSRSQARERARRRAREELSAPREGDSRELEPEKALERLEAHRRLVDAVRALDAPLRDALLWRYFDGLLPREIARRTGLPVRTVHTRLSRGLARLRSALERQEGPPLAAWLPLLLAPDTPRGLFGAAAAGSTSTLLGGLLVGTKTKLVAGAVLCSGLFFAWRALPGGPAEPPESRRTPSRPCPPRPRRSPRPPTNRPQPPPPSPPGALRRASSNRSPQPSPRPRSRPHARRSPGS